MKWMNEFHLNMRLDNKYYRRIYLHGIPGAVASTDDFDTEQEAIEVLGRMIQVCQVKIINADAD
jgi:hypothetical protein